ncbi:outer membrane protein [Fodinibius sp. Rm-B-1B1-1]|uniref:outer membrane protein n=1 Tax=Fodinibius alkaliphilus TaxID=3140241 RepID=UPI00315A7132
MKSIKYILAVVIFTCSLGMLPQMASAQTSIGASYEIRDEDPQNGFGLRLERGILGQLPIVDLGLRAHFSYFNDDISYENRTYSTDVTSYDYGLAAVGGVSLGLLSPYVGLGLGASTLDVTREDVGGVSAPEESNDSAFYWNGFVGAKVSPIPNIKPFVEYRFEDISDYENELNDVGNSSGRLIFGVSLSF